MSMDLAKQTFTADVSYFEADTNNIEKAVKTAGAALDAHTPVTIAADGTTVTQIAAATDDIYGITAESADASADVVVYIHGAFFADELVMPTGITAADIEVALRDKGIYLK